MTHAGDKAALGLVRRLGLGLGLLGYNLQSFGFSLSGFHLGLQLLCCQLGYFCVPFSHS